MLPLGYAPLTFIQNDLNFLQVHIHRNLPYGELSRLLEKTAAMDHTRSDCFALVFLSHGNMVSIMSVLTLNKLFKPVSIMLKIFFLIACKQFLKWLALHSTHPPTHSSIHPGTCNQEHGPRAFLFT